MQPPSEPGIVGREEKGLFPRVQAAWVVPVPVPFRYPLPVDFPDPFALGIFHRADSPSSQLGHRNYFLLRHLLRHQLPDVLHDGAFSLDALPAVYESLLHMLETFHII